MYPRILPYAVPQTSNGSVTMSIARVIEGETGEYIIALSLSQTSVSIGHSSTPAQSSSPLALSHILSYFTFAMPNSVAAKETRAHEHNEHDDNINRMWALDEQGSVPVMDQSRHLGSPSIVWKLDMTLMPIIWVLYLFNYLDRISIAYDSSTLFSVMLENDSNSSTTQAGKAQ